MKKKTLQDIQEWIKEQGSSTVIISNEYKNNKSPIIMKCECGEVFTSFWNRMSNTNKCRCNKCGEIERTKRRYSVKEVEEELNKYGYHLISNDFNNIHSIEIMDNDGYLYRSNLNRIRTHSFPMKFTIANPYLLDNLKNYIKLSNIDVEILSIDKNATDTKHCLLTLKCSCGNIFTAVLDSFLWQNQNRCSKCSRSKSMLEISVENYLDENKINYIAQHTFDDCINKRKLKYDFYLPEYNVVIEVQGQQHYYEQSNFCMSLQEQTERDKYKERYCKEHNISYIAIPFWHIYNSSKYKEIINKILE